MESGYVRVWETSSILYLFVLMFYFWPINGSGSFDSCVLHIFSLLFSSFLLTLPDAISFSNECPFSSQNCHVGHWQITCNVTLLLSFEICSEKLRSLNIISSFIAWICGVSIVSLVCWLLAEYKLILLVLNLPMAIFYFYWRNIDDIVSSMKKIKRANRIFLNNEFNTELLNKFLPESPRLLLTKDEIPKFIKVMRKIAAKNHSVITSEFDDLVLKAQEEEKKKVPFSQILRSFVLAKHLILFLRFAGRIVVKFIGGCV
ncbi:hypothetical protein Avbf_10097 [Armadillidium vulgare]|nr:hypothetical protein Avbf_10097 [Armadillidium vulgare]